jgi:hypothetical protein
MISIFLDFSYKVGITHLPENQSQSFEGRRPLTTPSHTILEMGGHLHGFYRGIAQYLPAP